MSSDSSAHGHILAIDNSVGVLALFTGLLGEEANRVSTPVYADRDLESTEALAPDLIIRDDLWASQDFGWSLLLMRTASLVARSSPEMPSRKGSADCWTMITSLSHRR